MPKSKSQEEFVNEIKEIFGEDYTIIGTYINNKTKILVRHNLCGHEFFKLPKDMISKHSGCPYCYGNKNKLYNEKWVIDNTPSPYIYVSGYTKMSQKCTFYCNNCKTDFLQTPSRIINEHIYGCNCCPTKRKTHQDFLNEISEELENYEILSDYININTPIKMKHKKCGAFFEISPDKFLHRYNKMYCPICFYKKSRGEIEINKFLIKEHISYKKEYSFLDLPNRKFDFYLPDFNMCIEFDGKQHFEKIDFFGGEEAFLKTQKRDQEKNKYCINNNILLIRIPYTEIENIQNILHLIFKEKSSETIEKYKIY